MSLQQGKRRRLYFGLISVAVVLFVTLIAEWGVRYRERVRDSIPGSFPSAYYRHSRLKAAMIRNHDYYGWFYVNNLGLRGDNVPLSKPPGEFRVLVVGGSTTFESQVSSDEHTWPARLEHWLHERGASKSVRVLNGGTPGYRVLDNTIRLQTEFFALEPDLVVLYHGHNDVSCAAAERVRSEPTWGGDRPHETRPASGIRMWLESNSELYNKVLWRVISILSSRWGQVAANEPPVRPDGGMHPLDCGAAQFERDLGSFVSVARGLNIPVVLSQVVHASGADALTESDTDVLEWWRNTRPYVKPNEVFPLYVQYRDVMADVARKFDVPFVPTGAFEIAGMQYYGLRDPMHFNDQGADLMGKSMAEALIAIGAIQLQ